MKAPLQEWFSAQLIDNEMLWKGAAGYQVMFVRDCIASVMGADAFVIATHRSKSITLPVYQIERADLGLTVTMRCNFYNWKLSVQGERPIEADFSGLFYTTPPIEPDYTGNPLSAVYFEGFPSELVFGYYEASDKRQWSAELHEDNALWTALYLVMRALGGIKACAWRTRDGHQAELKAEREARDAKRGAEAGGNPA